MINTGTYILNDLKLEDHYLIPEEHNKFSSNESSYQAIVLVYGPDKIFEVYFSKNIQYNSKKTKPKEIIFLNKNLVTSRTFVKQFISTELEELNLTEYQSKLMNIVITNFMKKKALKELYRKTKRTVFEEVYTSRRNINKATHPTIEKRIISYAKRSSLETLKLFIESLESQNRLYFHLNKVLSTKKIIFSAASSKSSLLEYQLCYGLKEVIRGEKKHYFSDLLYILEGLRQLSPQLFRDLPYINETNIRKAIERGTYPFKSEKRLRSPQLRNYDNYRMFKIEHWGISFLQKVS